MKVLIADTVHLNDPARIVEADLAAAGATEIVRLAAGELLADAVLRTAPDLVIVDMARPDRDGLEDIRAISRHDPRPIVMFVDQDDPAFMEAAIEAGVSSYNVVGASLPAIKPVVQAAVAMFRRYRQVETSLHKAETSLREREVVDQAKALLMRQRGMAEPDAYRWLRRQAMEQSRKLAAVAADIVAAAEQKKGGGS
ncbi:ANTAR domain-containing response regulator [Nitrospirillum viridazoti]|uniref:Response regulator receiver protein n=1 Tax=Nitrospirillum viridazoti CBAmc TaxID=1441467 RepID=A0A248JUU5_9PROT|nr:ANTAR domain-containing protein [Nitrospirillum amazonense]ASG22475.1 response regulator receiver protein [Nitrospirillum amazonense CBAmc]TWB42974.1 response regulator receiver and ANTAR domain protein [Nitrospirillum amazonense]